MLTFIYAVAVALLVTAAFTYKTMTGRAVIGKVMQRLGGSK